MKGARATVSIRQNVKRALKASKIRRENARVLAVLAVFVSLAVAGILMQNGRAMIREERVLDCPVAADRTVAHTHDESCYDDEGRLVCQLPEVELHAHDDSCYTEKRELVCGLEEGEGAHHHDESCYDEGNLACGLEESDGHVHDDGCYEITRTLTCGKDEITEAHAHGQGCFRTVVVDDGEAEEAEVASAAETEEPIDGETAKQFSAQTFEQRFVNNKNELQLRVFVDAPAGALPEGTTMRAEMVSPKKVDQDVVQNAVSERTEGRVLEFQAVDITFHNAQGTEIEPARDVTVTMTSALAATDEQPVVVHVESDREAAARAEAQGRRTYEIEADVVDQLSERELNKRDMELADDQLAFDAGAFSTYVLATASRDHTMKSTDNETVTITVDAKADAGIPQDAVIQVGEIGRGTVEYESYLAQAAEAVGAENVTLARFFDINIESGDQTLQPQAPVNVKVELMGAQIDATQSNMHVVHFGEKGPEVLGSRLRNETVSFEADGFSVYAVVLTESIRTEFLASTGDLYDVTVRYGEDAQIPEGSRLQVSEIAPGSEAYNNAYQLLFGSEPGANAPMLSVDISIVTPDGKEIEPQDAVTVDLKVKALPDGADAEEVQKNVEISHMRESSNGIVVETVASAAQVEVGETLDASFEVESFSQFNITWARGNTTRALIQVHYVDEDGNNLTGQQTTNLSTNTNNSQIYTFANYATRTIDEAEFIEAKLGSPSGSTVTSVTFSRETGWFGTYNYTRFYNGNTLISEVTSNTTYDVYLVYERQAPGLTISKTTTGATTPAGATFTVSSTDGTYTREFTYADMTNGKIKLEDAPAGKTYTVTESGADRNGYIRTTTYGGSVTLTESRPSGTLTVSNAYTNDPNVVKVYVYVAAYDEFGNQFKDNPEFLELLGISGDTVDGNGYFPVGEIYLDKSFFNGKPTSKWTALINSASDWEHVLAALGELDTSTLIYDQGVDYALNQGNSVGDYMDQAIGDVDKGAGSQCTALFGWSGHSYGFEDQSVEYHLDLRFQTHKVTFITGNNGIGSGASRDGTTVDVRAYIEGSEIQQPRNLVIPAGYRLVGYYNDPDFTTPWNKIGTPITQDEVAYIKITPQSNVILYYKPVPTEGGTVSLDAEGLNPETGTPAGSTATPNPGYHFVGWYADEACTQLLSTDARYTPTKASGERWVDGTTYYAKFEEDSVTLTFVAEDNIDRVELVTDADEVISVTGNGTKQMQVTVNQILGPSVTVRGVAADGYVVKEWTVEGRTDALTREESVVTAIEDDPSATVGHWTDRTYHVWAETEKTITVDKEVRHLGSLHATDINTTVYFVLWDIANERNVLDEHGEIWTQSIEIVDGVPQGTVSFTGLQSGSYSVWEVDAEGHDMQAGTVMIGDDIVISKIETRHSTGSGNIATVNDQTPTDEVTVINTYNHRSDVITWHVRKEWYTSLNTIQADQANVNIPEGATSTLALYRSDDLTTPLKTVVLDGVVDEDGEEVPWQATFEELQLRDEDENSIGYVVKEIAFTPESNENGYFYPYESQTNHDGGVIRNAVMTGSINVYKQIEVQPRSAEMDELVRNAVGNLKVRVTGPHGYDEVFEFTDTNDPYNPSLQITGLPAGEYTVAEMYYEDLLTGRKWNPTLSWIQAGNGMEQAGATSATFEVATAGASNDTVDVRMKNDYTKYDITATKVWDDSGIENANHPPVSLTLYRIDGEGNRTPVSTKIIGANQTGAGLTVKWEQQEQQDQQYTYEIVEAPVAGYVCTSVTGDMFDGFTVTNKRAASIKVVKVDQEGHALAGATFSLTGPEGSDIDESGLVSTIDDSGSALVYENTSAPFGAYVLTETNPPAGYNHLPGPIEIDVDVNENDQVVVTPTIGGETSAFAKAELIAVEHPEAGWVVTVMNDAGVALPAAGGSGSTAYYLVGTLVVLAGAFLLWRREA